MTNEERELFNEHMAYMNELAQRIQTLAEAVVVMDARIKNLEEKE